MEHTLSLESPQTAWHWGRATSSANQPAPAHEDTNTLIAHAQAGNVKAFNQLVMAVQDLAYYMAYRLLQCPETAADAVQESLIKAHRALPLYQGGNFKRWFLRILTNTCYDVLRLQKRRAATSFDELLIEQADDAQLIDPVEQPAAYIERMELRQWLQQGLQALPVEQRVVVVLYDVEGYSYNEISVMIAIPMGTVNSRLNRGRIQLRDFLLHNKVLGAPHQSASAPTP